MVKREMFFKHVGRRHFCEEQIGEWDTQCDQTFWELNAQAKPPKLQKVTQIRCHALNQINASYLKRPPLKMDLIAPLTTRMKQDLGFSSFAHTKVMEWHKRLSLINASYQ